MQYKINNKNFKIEIPSFELGIPFAKIQLEDGTIHIGKILEYYDDNHKPIHLGPNIIFTKDLFKNQIHTLVTINFGKVTGNILSLTSRIPSKLQLDNLKKLFIYLVEVGKSFLDNNGNAMQTWLDLVYSKKKSISREEYETLDYQNDSWSSMISTPFYKIIESLCNSNFTTTSKQITLVKTELQKWLNENAPELKEATDANKFPENRGLDF